MDENEKKAERLIAKAANHKSPDPVLKDVDRLTVNFAVHHEHLGDQPLSVGDNHSHLLAYREQAYGPRRLQVTDPVPLAEGSWVKQPGYVLIQNKTGSHQTTLPTEKEKADIAAAVLRVSVDNKGLCVLVRPGLEAWLEIEDLTEVTVQSLAGTADMTITVFPR